MFYLYLKTHNTTGLNYIGYTARDPFVYQGSGKYWTNHIKKHGYDVTTIVLYETPFREEIKEQGLYYSDLWNIVDSNGFANLMIESGIGAIHSEETRRKISNTKIGTTLTEEHKIKIGDARRGKPGCIHSKETKQKLSDMNKGKKHTEKIRQKISESHKGKQKSEDHKQKLSESHKGKVLSEDHKQKLSESHKGKPLSEVHKRNMSNAKRGKPQPKTTCPHCGKIGGNVLMARYHFENCSTKLDCHR